MTWRSRAACLEEDPELFFPLGESDQWTAQIRAAKSVCGGCPVVDACLRWALTVGENHGIWGATTALERRTLAGRYAGRRRSVAQAG